MRDGDQKELAPQKKDTEAQDYALITKMLGGCQVEARCQSDGRMRICRIRGTLRKKKWMVVGDWILIALRDFQDDKADVLLKYSTDQARQLGLNSDAAAAAPGSEMVTETIDFQTL